jgi:hypothetical protein
MTDCLSHAGTVKSTYYAVPYGRWQRLFPKLSAAGIDVVKDTESNGIDILKDTESTRHEHEFASLPPPVLLTIANHR